MPYWPSSLAALFGASFGTDAYCAYTKVGLAVAASAVGVEGVPAIQTFLPCLILFST